MRKVIVPDGSSGLFEAAIGPVRTFERGGEGLGGHIVRARKSATSCGCKSLGNEGRRELGRFASVVASGE